MLVLGAKGKEEEDLLIKSKVTVSAQQDEYVYRSAATILYCTLKMYL